LSGGCEGKTLLAAGIKAYRSRIPLNREGLNPGGLLLGVGTLRANHAGETDNLYAFFSFSLPRISSIIFPCSRQMDRRMVAIGQA
jgi:hypothetical protein